MAFVSRCYVLGSATDKRNTLPGIWESSEVIWYTPTSSGGTVFQVTGRWMSVLVMVGRGPIRVLKIMIAFRHINTKGKVRGPGRIQRRTAPCFLFLFFPALGLANKFFSSPDAFCSSCPIYSPSHPFITFQLCSKLLPRVRPILVLGSFSKFSQWPCTEIEENNCGVK